ncbi:SDR family oxidoreductase [Raineya orbicola]|jgi:UDP-N-acetylglucosamine 4-epimerase|uniref:Nucleoside-diphosphate-sugar epimerase n=1 Tax=Raineya orbicola TaxID=2016530 RepID=A0A2N3IHL7_9BACT|nr:SDR family oxidoreductase [Raineya orbicola]PKQ69748.1 Nucleoside-diphosphate-sugar epimerase [Raineya orbicola]
MQYQSQDISRFNFLVTGGAGFIGSNIVAYLIDNQAKKIRILDNLSTGYLKNIEPFLSLPNVEFIQGDIASVEMCLRACEGIDYVFHQAALGSVPRSIQNPLASHEANVTGFLNILWACKENKVKRLVYASSSSVYGDSPILPKKEHQIGKPLSPYALTKSINEQYAEVFARVYGTESIGLRYFNVFGYNQSPEGAYAAVIPLFMKALQSQKSPIIHGDGKQTRDFTFVENAVQANIRAMFVENPEAVNRVYNIACGEQLSVLEIFEILRDFFKVDIEPQFTESRKGDIRDSLADISDAQKFLGYKPTIFAKEGLKLTAEWFRENL